MQKAMISHGRKPARVATIGVVAALLLLACVGVAPASAIPSSFGSTGEGAGQFIEPRGIALAQPSGDIYLVDRNNQRVEKFGPEGETLLAWGWGVADGHSPAAQSCTTTCFAGLEGSGSGQFEFPEAIAVDNDPLSSAFSDVYVADTRNHRIEQFDANGNFISMFGGEVNKTADLIPGATEAEKNVCTAVSGNVCGVGTQGGGNGQFEGSPRAVAVGPEGTVYVGDLDRVQEFSPGGVYKGQVTVAGAGEISSVVLDSSKNLSLTSTELLGVHKYSGAGTELGAPRDSTGEPTALALGASASLFVNDGRSPASHHILEYDASGEQISSFDANAEGGFRGIAYSEERDLLYVVNENTVRIVSPPAPGPLVIANSEAASSIEPTTATLNAVANPEGAAKTEAFFEYGETTTYGSSTAPAVINEGAEGAFIDHPTTAELAGLQPSTEYHFRVVVTNAKGETTVGPDTVFTTLPPVVIASVSASQVSANSAKLATVLNPLGRATLYRFEYGTTTAYGSNAPSPDGNGGAGRVEVGFNLVVEDLTPNTLYHYRVEASNALGPVFSADHTFVTQASEAVVLPDGRQWEMVSPSDKKGVSLESISEEGSVIQAAEDGSGITYIAKAPIDSEPAGNRSIENTQILSRRGSPGVWSTTDITTPHESVAIFHPGFPSEYRLFAGNLSSGALEPQGATPLSAQTTERTPYRREENGEYVPLVTAANVPEGTKFEGEESHEEPGAFSGGVSFVTATPSLQHVIVSSPQPLTPGFESGGTRSLYEWTGGQLQLISVLPGGEPAATLGLPTSIGNNEFNMRGAVSLDGNRVFFETNGGTPHLYVRDMALKRTALVDVAEEGLSTGLARPEFQGASADGSKVFFTDEARLTLDSTARASRPDLYMCEVRVSGGAPSCVVRDLTIDHNTGQAADVQGVVLAVDESGTHVYFAANGVLAAGAQPAECAEVSVEQALCNIYAYNTATRQTKLVAVVSSADAPDWDAHVRHNLGNLTARVSSDGRYLAFMSLRSLTGYDNRDANSGERDEEVYLFDAGADSIRCVSCRASGARPEGVFDRDSFPGLLVDRPQTWGGKWLAASIPGMTLMDTTHSIYQSRYLSDSGRMFFNSADALVPQDANSKEDVYEFEPGGVGDCGQESGCVGLVSSGGSSEESAFLDASNNGDDVFLLTSAKLAVTDIDGGFDVYDAHVCSAGAPCPAPAASTPPPCDTTDSCRAAPAAQPPIAGPPSSQTFSGVGNLTPPPASPIVQPKKITRAQHLAKALKACEKKPKKRRAACRAQARKQYGPVHAAKGRKSKAKSGAKKGSKR